MWDKFYLMSVQTIKYDSLVEEWINEIMQNNHLMLYLSNEVFICYKNLMEEEKEMAEEH